MAKYYNPIIRTFSGREVAEVTGPVQAAYLNLYFQQIEQVSSSEIPPPIEKEEQVAFGEAPKIYRYSIRDRSGIKKQRRRFMG